MKNSAPAVELSKKVGRYIHDARKRCHVTQGELCGRAAAQGFYLSVSILSKIENARKYVTIYDLLVISQCLGVPADWLLKGDTEYGEGTANRDPAE